MSYSGITNKIIGITDNGLNTAAEMRSLLTDMSLEYLPYTGATGNVQSDHLYFSNVNNSTISGATGGVVITKDYFEANNLPFEGYFESGTKSGGDLIVNIGDYNDSNNGVNILIDDNTKEITALGLKLTDGYYYIDTGIELGDIGGVNSTGRIRMNLDESDEILIDGNTVFNHNVGFKDAQNSFFNASGDGSILLDASDIGVGQRVVKFRGKQGRLALMPVIETITATAYDIVLDDEGDLIILDNVGGITVTIPTDATLEFPNGSVISLIQIGAGIVTIEGAGVTILNNVGGLIMAQYDRRSITKIALNTWVVAY